MAEVNLWELKANGQVACSVGSKTSNLAQNMLVTKAYAKLYIENPKVFKWGRCPCAVRLIYMGHMPKRLVCLFQ